MSFENPFKNKTVDFFPIPIFETRPDEGESYGLMPVVLFSDKKTESIKLILAVIGQYNSITKWSGAGIAYWYPNPNKNPEEVFEVYGEVAQKYYREVLIHYTNPKFLSRFFLDTQFLWLKTPFTRFYGYGAQTTEGSESNYVSRNYSFKTKFGYYINEKLRLNLTETFTTTDILTRAFSNVDNTLTRYGNQAGVVDSTNWLHQISVSFDSRPNGKISKRGTYLEGSYFFSVKGFGSDNTLNGFNIEAVQLIPFFKERTITALRFFAQDMYGQGIPFYLQSRLGGAFELRSFIPDRFTDTGKIIMSWEQRIKVVAMKAFGVPVEIYADPFIEIGRVFHHFNNLGFGNFQTVGGLGLRAVVPPNVVARVDVSVGTEGYGIYTVLGYAF